VTHIICGVDVSATTLDARIGRDGEYRRFDVSADGLADLIAFCQAHQVGLVVMEATGGYERRPAGHLWAAELPTAIVNPRAVRDFAKAMGVLEKTDRIDCGIIAWYAETKRIKPTPPAAATQARLTALVRRLRQLTDLRTQQTNQRRLIVEPDVLASFAPILAAIASQQRQLETLIAQAIGDDPLWVRLDAAFRTIKGVADRTVARLMAEMPEIGTLSNKAVGKLAGLAPIARDSGQHNGKRKVRGGREGVRSILFVIAEVVRRYDPDFAAFHQRLSRAGKPNKVIRVAIARKLLVRLNAKARQIRRTTTIPA
jgi:transposase